MVEKMFPMTFLYGRTIGKLGLYIETIVSLLLLLLLIIILILIFGQKI